MDFFVPVMVKEVIPFMLALRQFAHQLACDLEAREKLFTGRDLNVPLTVGAPLAYLDVCFARWAITVIPSPKSYVHMQVDASKDERAAAIIAEKGVTHVRWMEDGGTWMATALVKSSSLLSPAYCCTVYPPESICCDCMDFRCRGGFCKHLRAAVAQVPVYVGEQIV